MVKGALLAASLSACAVDPVGPAGVERLPRLALPGVPVVASASEAKRLGQTAFREGNFPLSLRYFQIATETLPEDPEVWLGLGVAADRSGHFDTSALAYGKAEKLIGPSVELYNNRGFSYLLQGRLFEARAAFRAGLKLAPENVTLKNNLSLVDKLEGQRPVGRSK